MSDKKCPLCGGTGKISKNNGIVVFVDGSCEPTNPGGVATLGVAIMYPRNNSVFEIRDVVGEGGLMSNNVAEYEAVCRALINLIECKNIPITIKSDSQLVVNQMNGEWSVRGGLYYDRYKTARTLANDFDRLEFVWIPREQNYIADRLAREAYEDYCAKNGRGVRYHA